MSSNEFPSGLSTAEVISRRGGNWVSYWVLSGTLLGLLAVTCVPMLAESFAFAPTTWQRWLGAGGIGASAFILFETAKWIGARKQRS